MLNEEKVRYMTGLAIFERMRAGRYFPSTVILKRIMSADRCSAPFSVIPSAIC